MSAPFEQHVVELGRSLSESLSRVMAAAPGQPQGPVQLARALGLDKVLASRALRAAASRDPVASLRLMPGPVPLRRIANAAGDMGVDPKLVHDLEQAATRFEELIRTEAGDRSGLDAMLASWVPESRGEFELRRKQSAFRAMSQLAGKSVDTQFAAVVLHPSAEGSRMSVVWVTGFLGLQRLRPGIAIKFASRRLGGGAPGEQPRHPQDIHGRAADTIEALCLPEYCTSPMPPLNTERIGDVIHYTLGPTGFGPRSKLDLVYAEVNPDELPRFVPHEPGRRRYVFAEVGVPAEQLVFDVFIHRDLLGATPPALYIYDTVLEGIASVNDRSRDSDRMDLRETLQDLGDGLSNARLSAVPWNIDLLQTVCANAGWNPEELHGFRTMIDYPLYGSQVTVAWEAEFEGA